MWKLDIIESERGYGRRVDEVKEFDTEAAAAEFQRKFNAENTPVRTVVPDWYMYAATPYKV
jgi:hypothetical protein